MSWQDFIQTARVRALEEAAAQDQVWDSETRRMAVQIAQSRAGRQPSSFLPSRANWLMEKVKDATLKDHLNLPAVPGWFALVWIGAFLVGWWLAALGQ